MDEVEQRRGLLDFINDDPAALAPMRPQSVEEIVGITHKLTGEFEIKEIEHHAFLGTLISRIPVGQIGKKTVILIC